MRNSDRRQQLHWWFGWYTVAPLRLVLSEREARLRQLINPVPRELFYGAALQALVTVDPCGTGRMEPTPEYRGMAATIARILDESTSSIIVATDISAEECLGQDLAGQAWQIAVLMADDLDRGAQLEPWDERAPEDPMLFTCGVEDDWPPFRR